MTEEVCPITGFKFLKRSGICLVFADERGHASHAIPEIELPGLETTPKYLLEMLDSKLYDIKDEISGNSLIALLMSDETYGYEWVPTPYGH